MTSQTREEMVAQRISELACDKINNLFDDLDPHTHEQISFAVYDAALAALPGEKELCGVSAQSETGVASQLLGGWRPIETAPKDGTLVDLWVVFSEGDGEDAKRWANSHFNVEDGVWVNAEGYATDQYMYPPAVTHWQPLPEPPVPAKQALKAPPVEASADTPHA